MPTCPRAEFLGDCQPCLASVPSSRSHPVFTMQFIACRTATMNEEKLCDPCVKLMRGDREGKPQLYGTHHPDAESLRRALRLPCNLCCFIWAAPTIPVLTDDEVTHGSRYRLNCNPRPINIVNGVSFYQPRQGIGLVRLEPWKCLLNVPLQDYAR
jgi:hypothetical protein